MHAHPRSHLSATLDAPFSSINIVEALNRHMVRYFGAEVGKHLDHMVHIPYLFLNLLFNPARPAKPEPRRSMVAGSGTGEVGSQQAKLI